MGDGEGKGDGIAPKFVSKGVEVDVCSKASKVEEGAWKLGDADGTEVALQCPTSNPAPRLLILSLTHTCPTPAAMPGEGVRKLEVDVTTLRTQRVQLESNLKARDREIDRLGKTVEQLKGELHDTHARWVRWEFIHVRVCIGEKAAEGAVLSGQGQGQGD